MEKRLNFKVDYGYLGRNGYGRATALNIRDLQGCLSLQPVTKTRQQIARCEIIIPRSPDFLRELATTLTTMVDEIEGGA